MRKWRTTDDFESGDHFEDGSGAAGAEIVGFEAGGL